ncbi:hypothetical protein EVAR_77864_1 [Eumeta japonica]|uniref:Uncharacterized protein n=1 Tax=Eumeta variegata TaxID=151549 RepID=A0A4C1TCD0_EUMVA|nr:hypothetical protein EVAR_77864_1 [Eumeta japonica]
MVKASRERKLQRNVEEKKPFLLAESTRGHKGNERADELAKSLPKRLMPTMITRNSLSWIKNKIRRDDSEMKANTTPPRPVQ